MQLHKHAITVSSEQHFCALVTSPAAQNCAERFGAALSLTAAWAAQKSFRRALRYSGPAPFSLGRFHPFTFWALPGGGGLPSLANVLPGPSHAGHNATPESPETGPAYQLDATDEQYDPATPAYATKATRRKWLIGASPSELVASSSRREKRPVGRSIVCSNVKHVRWAYRPVALGSSRGSCSALRRGSWS